MLYYIIKYSQTKHSEAKELVKSCEGLMVKGQGDKAAEATKTAEESAKEAELKAAAEKVAILNEKCAKVLKDYESLQGQLEQRSKLALTFIILLKRQRQVGISCWTVLACS